MNNTEKNPQRRYEDIQLDRRQRSQADSTPRDLREKLEKTFDTSINEDESSQLKAGL